MIADREELLDRIEEAFLLYGEPLPEDRLNAIKSELLETVLNRLNIPS